MIKPGMYELKVYVMEDDLADLLSGIAELGLEVVIDALPSEVEEKVQ